jgi:predicted RNA-binding Zn ribbon-like protein
LRETLYRLFKSVVEKWRADPADIERLNEELYIARGHQTLVSTGNKLGWKWDDTDEALDRVLWPLALAGAELLSSGDLSRLRQCGGEECGWLFLDTSRNRSRQWCEMSECGNLAKVRRFRQRQAKAHPG